MGTKTFDRVATLGLYTETTLHCGAESAAGYVDLPVQRERHTGFPLIPGSTLKGVLKDEMRAVLPTEEVLRWFGIQDSAGLVSFSDGALVAFPVRSSPYPFHWVTCSFVLERAFRAIGLRPGDGVLSAPGERSAWAKSPGDVVVEELHFTKVCGGVFTNGEAIKGLLSLLPATEAFKYTREIFEDRLLVVSDDDFRFLTETGTEIITRIKLNCLGTTTTIDRRDKEDVARRLGMSPGDLTDDDLQGNMFVEEVVPPETLFLCTVRSSASFPVGRLPSIVRIGGDETIGRGLTHVTVA